MVDAEAADKSNREQVVLVLRHVGSNLNVTAFVGMYMLYMVPPKTLTSVIEDTMTKKNISLKNCRGLTMLR